MGILLLLYVLDCAFLGGSRLRASYLQMLSRTSATILASIGYVTDAVGNEVIVSSYRFEVAEGCDGFGPLAAYLAAVVATPASWASRAAGWVLGTIGLIALNQMRLVIVLMVAVAAPDSFDWIHYEIGQPIFVVATIAIWMLWAGGAMRRTKNRAVVQSA